MVVVLQLQKLKDEVEVIIDGIEVITLEYLLHFDKDVFYGFAILNGTLSANAANAKQYFEALVAYGRGD